MIILNINGCVHTFWKTLSPLLLKRIADFMVLNRGRSLRPRTRGKHLMVLFQKMILISATAMAVIMENLISSQYHGWRGQVTVQVMDLSHRLEGYSIRSAVEQRHLWCGQCEAMEIMNTMTRGVRVMASILLLDSSQLQKLKSFFEESSAQEGKRS